MVHSFLKAFAVWLVTELGISQDVVSVTLETRVTTLGFIKIIHQCRQQYTYTCIKPDLVPHPLEARLNPHSHFGICVALQFYQ